MDHEEFCLAHDSVHAPEEPLTLWETLLIFWGRTSTVPYVSRQTLRRRYARELGLPVPTREYLEQHKRLYMRLAKLSILCLLVCCIILASLLAFMFQRLWH